jgi:tetratricopeptide (TPR) repeat protein
VIRRVPALAAVAAAVLALCWTASIAAADVMWRDGAFDDVMAAAAKAGKPVMIDFYTTWCGPCKLLDKSTYVDSEVTAYSTKFVNMKVDCEKGEGVELAKRFKIMNYPTIVFLKSDGSEIDRHIGYLGPKDFLQLMKDYYNGVNTLDYFVSKMKEDGDDVELVFTVASKYVDRADRENAMPLLDKVMELDPENERGYAERALMQKADAERKAGDLDQAIADARAFIERYPQSENAKNMLYDLAYYQEKAGRLDGALATHKELIERYPDDTGAMNSLAWFCAKKGVGLELATEVAERAATLSGGDPGILDTLAEVYYARGMYDEAIDTINSAIAKEPEDGYLKGQLAKFKKAREEASGM